MNILHPPINVYVDHDGLAWHIGFIVKAIQDVPQLYLPIAVNSKFWQSVFTCDRYETAVLRRAFLYFTIDGVLCYMLQDAKQLKSIANNSMFRITAEAQHALQQKHPLFT